MSKEDNFKEKFKLALLSTANAIADDYSPNNDKKNKKKSKIDLFELDKLESRSDFVKYRAEIDSGALKRKFSNTEIFRNKARICISFCFINCGSFCFYIFYFIILQFFSK